MDPSIDESRDNAEEFETVDSIPEQDEEVTTTSFSGETVEADRYEPGYSSPAKTADAWLKNVDPRVLELIYWRDVKKTGVVFGSMLFVLLSLSCFSVLSVLAYLSLAVLTVTLSFRIYKNVLQAVQKSGEGHPFKQFLEMNIDLPEDKAREAVVNILKHLNCTIRELRRLFLVEDLVDSIKFGLLLWVLTYVGSWFNGMTIIILDVIAIFTLPKVYETYKVQIDHYVDLARTHRDNMWKQVQAKVPFLKKKEKKL
ncbi:reticulon-1-A-like isoform X15 [Ostrea edulis]|uniref:reticulon-1-A-like isoform X15 n=1 Tax=Ostrea edulis TaxID=37623 RepID=UPI00209494F5|nr:reticulon-1-A-like isoform X15 [Ostrea edulis]